MPQVCLPGCDVPDLIKAQPTLFLGSHFAERQISHSYEQLQEQLPDSVDVDAIVQDQPAVLFQSSAALHAALQQIRVLHLKDIEPADAARLLMVYQGSPRFEEAGLPLEFIVKQAIQYSVHACSAFLSQLFPYRRKQ